MVGYVLPQTRGGTVCFKAAGGATVWTSHAKYFERGEYEGRCSKSVKQLTEFLTREILIYETR